MLANLAEDTNVGAVLDEVVSDYGSNLTMQVECSVYRSLPSFPIG